MRFWFGRGSISKAPTKLLDVWSQIATHTTSNRDVIALHTVSSDTARALSADAIWVARRHHPTTVFWNPLFEVVCRNGFGDQQHLQLYAHASGAVQLACDFFFVITPSGDRLHDMTFTTPDYSRFVQLDNWTRFGDSMAEGTLWDDLLITDGRGCFSLFSFALTHVGTSRNAVARALTERLTDLREVRS